MRVYEPKRQNTKKHRKNLPRPIVKVILILVFASLLIIVFNHLFAKNAGELQPNQNTSNVKTDINEPAKTGELKKFTANQFMELYDNLTLPNTQMLAENTEITGNMGADKHIESLALKRGYKRRSAPIQDNFKTVDYGLKLQQKASEDWQKLKDEAKKDNVHIGLTSAYRSADEARQIFLQALATKGVNINSIASGVYDSKINDILKTVAPPGFSRHHSGYTVDISCEDVGGSFESTPCFTWLSKDNYKNAKLQGWIPSYPKGIKNQGPDPEAWEYLWVGKENLTN